MDSLGSIRTESAPRRTITAYKLMRLVDGKLYPLYIDNSAPVELGVWYNADSPDFEILKTLPSGYCYLIDSNNRVIERTTRLLNDNQTKLRTSADVVAEIEAATAKQQRWIWIEKTNSAQRRFSGENRRYWNLGINGSGTPNHYSMRPGWHAGSLPTMLQVWCGSQNDKKTKDNFVFTECEISADIDYNAEAQRNPDKDLPDKMPVDGYYLKATNADKRAAQADRVGWYVAGAIKINRIISDSEAHAIIDRYNAQHPDDEPVQYQWPRESGKMFNADTMSLEGLDGRRYYGGNSGYQGYSKSNRAVDAEKRGLRSKSQMDNDFADKVNELIKAENPAAKKVTLAQIKKHLDNITADEWHHTSKFGNRTNYYSVERVATHFIDNIKIANATPISFVAKEDIDKILDYLQDSTCNDGKGRYLASNGVVVDVHRGEPPFSRAYNEGSVETRYISRYVEPYELDEPQRSMLVDALAEANNRRKMIVEAERTKSLFNESAAYERVRAAIVGGGLQGTKRPQAKGLGFAMFRFSDTKEQFEQNYSEAVERRGIVREDLDKLRFPIYSLKNVRITRQKDFFASVYNYAKEHGIIGEHTIIVGNNIGTLNIGRSFFEKCASNKAIKKSDTFDVHKLSIVNILDIVNNSFDVEIHPNVLKNEQGEREWGKFDEYTLMHRLFSAVEYDGKYYCVKTTLKENLNNKNTAYTIENTKIELLDRVQGTPSTPVVINNSISAAILLKNVEKSYDKGVFLIKNQNNTLSGTISPDQLALFGDEPLPKQSHYGLLFDETDAKWNLTAEDIALIDELQKEYSEKITANEPERNRRNAQLAYCLIKFLKGESDAVTKNLSSSWYLTNRAYINPEYARYEYIADFLYHNPITRNIVRKYVPDLKGMSGSIKKMFEFLIELYKQQKNAKTDDANWFDAEELKRRLAEDDGKTGEKLLEIAAKQAGIPTAEPEPTADEPQNASDTYRFAEELAKLYADGEKFDFGKAKTINRQKGYNFTTNQLMQACELAVVIRATQIAQGHEIMTLKERYDQLVDLYGRQVTIQPKDSRASSLQQYSTPAPLAFLLGCFVKNWLHPIDNRAYFEPTAGNGMLTIALDHNCTTVNELDDVRFHNLQQMHYEYRYNEDICNPSPSMYVFDKSYSGVIMNPPFGLLDKKDFLTRKGTIDGRDATYTFERLDHKIAILSLEKMRDNGRAAIIIGGKMSVKLGDWKESYWKNGALFGQYRTFITYLHRQYNIVDVLYINGDLYRKQGTTFPIVAILIDGRTEWNDSREHQWHKFDELRDNQIDTFNELFLRLEKFAVNPDREANVANYRRLYEPKIEQPDRKRAQALLMLAKAKIKIAQAQQAQRMKQ